MKYLNTYDKLFESSHWKDDLIKGGKLSFHRKDSIEEVFYELMDNGYHVRISQELYDGEFNYPGKKIDFLSDNKNLYEGYKIAFNNNSTNPMDIDKIIENQEEEIIILKRLKDMGFVMRVVMSSHPTISLYHTDDIISKNLFIVTDKDFSFFKKFRGNLIEAEEKLTKVFSKIAYVSKLQNGNLIMRLDPHSDNGYTLDQLYKFTKKVLINDVFVVDKIISLRRSTEPDALEISLKKYK